MNQLVALPGPRTKVNSLASCSYTWLARPRPPRPDAWGSKSTCLALEVKQTSPIKQIKSYPRDLIVVQAQAAAKHHLAQLADHVKMIQSSGSHHAPIFLRDMSQGRNQNRPYMSHIAAKSHAFTQRIEPSTRVRPAHFDRKHNGRQQVLETS